MRCRICGNEHGNQTYSVKEMMFGYGDVFQYFQCASCSCLQIADIPVSLSKYYPDNYYSYQPRSVQSSMNNFLIGLRNNYAVLGIGYIGRLLYAIRPLEEYRFLYRLSVSRDTSILDIGCGAGTLLCYLRELGFRNLLGIDPFSAQDIEYHNGLRIKKGDIDSVEGKWDLVMFNHSFEHVPDPAETMQRAADLLTPGGHMIIRIPTVSSYAWKHYAVNWVQLDAPRHLYLHSVDSMIIMANQTGLDLHSVIYDSSAFQFWGSEQYIAGIPLRDQRSYSVNPKESIFSRHDISIFDKRAKKLNKAEQGDQAVFYLRQL